ncbi:hypothetical protein RHMOL_Rhmol10G0286300 [Rhododendron molle]|uniref:Uncharacterized protein n=1 Tax=Rhododendron molle TaxID=49168 RepID=A0ACC0M7L8_RHOML|nr:hypothetical protein RHMOL_Rhmol10G0286300 [Rhododendron molle]
MAIPMKMKGDLKALQALLDQFETPQAARIFKMVLQNRILTGSICTARKQLSYASSGVISLRKATALHYLVAMAIK